MGIHRRVIAVCAFVLALTAAACTDGVGPRPAGATIEIGEVSGSVFEGDTVRLSARVFDGSGLVVPAAPVAWTVGDTTLAVVVGNDVLVLLKPGTVRITAQSGSAEATYDLAIGRLVVESVELTPDSAVMGRTDRLTISARVLGQGGRTITGRPIAFASDDTLVATVVGPASEDSPPAAFLTAVGSGSTAIHASVDGVAGTTRVTVVNVDTTFALGEYEGHLLPVLVDTISIDSVPNLQYEIDVDSGTLVLSGLLQKRYEIAVPFSVYRVTRTGDTIQRVLIAQPTGQFDRGLVTVGAGGTLSLVSEIVGPLLEHTATLRSDGYAVRYRIPGEDQVLDLGFRRDGS